MEEEREITDTGQPLDIYGAKLTLRDKDGTKTVRVQIRPYKKGNPLRKDFPFPEKIDERDLPHWKYYRGEQNIVYHRKGRNNYINMNNNSKAHTDLAQRLEILVRKVYFEKPIKNSK
jgi:hypothetical protein